MKTSRGRQDKVLRFDDESELSDDGSEFEGGGDIPENPLDVVEDSDDHQSEVPDHFGEYDGFRLFDCAKVVGYENLTLVCGVCTLNKWCRRPFGSRTVCIKPARACPATKEIAATLRSVSGVEEVGKQQCSQCHQECLLAASV
ncbi:hypothetical protein G7046_g2576 [Stylonectria norvegica]|nr:hypothetical protein G7046_g2576 [Stylonectria norvegica]